MPEHSSGGILILVILGVVFLVGLHLGRRRGLKHLGQAEFEARWRTVRKHSPF